MTPTTLAAERITISDHTIDEARSAPVSPTTTLILRAADGEEVTLPANLQKMLLNTLASIADTGEVSIGRTPENLTSTVAADLLGVSRPTLMKWAREGEIDSFKVRTHTRFKRDEVLRVRTLRAQQRSAAFDDLRAFDAEHEESFEG